MLTQTDSDKWTEQQRAQLAQEFADILMGPPNQDFFFECISMHSEILNATLKLCVPFTNSIYTFLSSKQ